ncbi:MAG: protein kinase [Legionellaceae bacterium]|nr:protein kinase [Legionellaceae bacterium]
MPAIIIDPTCLSPEEGTILIDFLNHVRQRPEYGSLLRQDESFESPSGVIFSLKYSVLWRARKPEKEGERYEVFNINHYLAAGSCGSVYDVQGTLKLSSGTLLFFKKQRVIKVLSKITSNVEVELYRNNKTLHAKKLSYDKLGQAYLVMRKIPGVTLRKILHDPNFKLVCLEQRLSLSITLLRALQEQVSAAGIIHRDIKPSNIMVMSNLSLVIIIDFGVAVYADSPDRTPIPTVGAPGFVAPEVYEAQATPASDVFSIAKVISFILGADPNERGHNWEHCISDMLRENSINYHGKLPDLPGLSSEIKGRLEEVLTKMSIDNPDYRMTLLEAIEVFVDISVHAASYAVTQEAIPMPEEDYHSRLPRKDTARHLSIDSGLGGSGDKSYSTQDSPLRRMGHFRSSKEQPLSRGSSEMIEFGEVPAAAAGV